MFYANYMAYPIHQNEFPVILLTDEEWGDIWLKAKDRFENEQLLVFTSSKKEHALYLAWLKYNENEKLGFYKNIIEQ